MMVCRSWSNCSLKLTRFFTSKTPIVVAETAQSDSWIKIELSRESEQNCQAFMYRLSEIYFDKMYTLMEMLATSGVSPSLYQWTNGMENFLPT